MTRVPPGTLWQSILRTEEKALLSGALVPIPTDSTFIDDAGVRFSVRVLAGLRRKTAARKQQAADQQAGRGTNPFLPPEQDLTVAGITGTHLAILNKFNVVPRHLLIITRQFEDQEMLLTPSDFEALWICMAEFNGLGFYNGGGAAGASQRHKHLQMVPLPLAPEGPPVPMMPLLAATVLDADRMGSVPAFPFRHAFSRLAPDLWQSPLNAARTTMALYARMLESVGMRPPVRDGLTVQSLPYCLLMTREWMLLVPRSREHAEEISLNSLAYAGSFFVASEALLERLKAYGPMNALRDVAIPLA
jgi:ATP adenylyltransferase